MADLETLKALADQIAIFAVTLKESGFTVCISNGDVSEDARKKFQEMLMEAIASNQHAANQAKSENPYKKGIWTGPHILPGETLGERLDVLLGEDKTKKVCEDIALVLANHGLVQSPVECELLFLYMISVTEGWNSL